MRYLAVGGFAVAAHGRPRYTKDLDLWIEVSPDNATRIVTVLDKFGFASFGLTPQDFLDPDVVIQLGYEPNRVDFITNLSGVAFADAYPKRTLTRFGTLEVPVTSMTPGSSPMTNENKIARVVRKVRRDALDEDAERRTYWRSRTPEERVAEVESLRRLWPELTGDSDQPMVRVVHRRRLGEPAIQPPR